MRAEQQFVQVCSRVNPPLRHAQCSLSRSSPLQIAASLLMLPALPPPLLGNVQAQLRVQRDAR